MVMGPINWKIWLFIMCFYFILPLASAASGNPDVSPSIESGKKIYLSNCAGCHGEKGDGSAFPGAFNFTDREKMNKSNSSVFFDAITNGISGTAMPSFGRLSENERWDVIAYINTFQFGDFQPGVPQKKPASTVGQQYGKEWYNTTGGSAMIIISAGLTIYILYLFIRGLKER